MEIFNFEFRISDQFNTWLSTLLWRSLYSKNRLYFSASYSFTFDSMEFKNSSCLSTQRVLKKSDMAPFWNSRCFLGCCRFSWLSVSIELFMLLFFFTLLYSDILWSVSASSCNSF